MTQVLQEWEEAGEETGEEDDDEDMEGWREACAEHVAGGAATGIPDDALEAVVADVKDGGRCLASAASALRTFR